MCKNPVDATGLSPHQTNKNPLAHKIKIPPVPHTHSQTRPLSKATNRQRPQARRVISFPYLLADWHTAAAQQQQQAAAAATTTTATVAYVVFYYKLIEMHTVDGDTDTDASHGTGCHPEATAPATAVSTLALCRANSSSSIDSRHSCGSSAASASEYICPV